MGYLVGGPAVSASRYPVDGVATAGQTIIPVPGGFQPGFVDVFVGGARLSPGDFTDTSGTQIVLAKPMAAGTQFNVTAWNPTMVVRNTNVPRVTVEQDATAGQTTIVVPGGFLAGMTDVYIGGTLLQRSDYNDSDGQTIVLAKALSLGTSIKVYGWNPGLVAQPVGGQLASWRNKLINGGFGISQRGTTTNVNGYSADRWNLVQLGGVSCTYSQNTWQNAECQQAYAANTSNYATYNVTNGGSAANDLVIVSQYVENVRTLAGQNAVLSGYVYTDKALSIGVEVSQFFGTGGSPSAENQFYHSKLSIPANTWTRFALPVAIPTLAGVTFGTNNNHSLNVNFWLSAGASNSVRSSNIGFQTGNFLFSKLQLEAGNVATQFEDRPLGTELALCQRYFEKSYSVGVNPGSPAGPGRCIAYYGVTGGWTQNGRFWVPYKVSKRGLPTSITLYSDAAGTAGQASNGSGVGYTVGIQSATTEGFEMVNTSGGSQDGAFFNWVSSAEL